MTRTTEKRVRTKALRSLSIIETKREREGGGGGGGGDSCKQRELA